MTPREVMDQMTSLLAKAPGRANRGVVCLTRGEPPAEPKNPVVAYYKPEFFHTTLGWTIEGEFVMAVAMSREEAEQLWAIRRGLGMDFEYEESP